MACSKGKGTKGSKKGSAVKEKPIKKPSSKKTKKK